MYSSGRGRANSWSHPMRVDDSQALSNYRGITANTIPAPTFPQHLQNFQSFYQPRPFQPYQQRGFQRADPHREHLEELGRKEEEKLKKAERKKADERTRKIVAKVIKKERGGGSSSSDSSSSSSSEGSDNGKKKQRKQRRKLKKTKKELTEENAEKTFKGTVGTRYLKIFLEEKGYKYTSLKDNMVAVAKELLRGDGKDDGGEKEKDEMEDE
eukprot:Phypoly_transcript_00293.p3 GENE.Phypoly_transcript_00293~~Phypoly_transcript_00293.p3  ORF type:complete len:212 (+),score=61.95 Phypoly_transcript_00293:635-1270(+)